MAFSRSAVKIGVMVPSLLAFGLVGVAYGNPADGWGPGTQKCAATTGNKSCNSSPTTKPGPSPEDMQARNEAREKERQRRQFRYDQLVRQWEQVYAEIKASDSLEFIISSQLRIRDILGHMKTIYKSPKLVESIKRNEANLRANKEELRRANREDDQTKKIEKANLDRRTLMQSHSDRGAGYLAQGDSIRAISEYSEAIRLDPSAVNPRIGRAQAHYYLGGYASAARDADEAVRMDPTSASALDYRTAAHARLNELSEMGVVQTNPGANTVEGRAIRAGAPPSACGATGSTAFGQLQSAAGSGSIGCAIENRSDDVVPSKTLVTLALVHASDALPAEVLAWYDKAPAFRQANAKLARTLRLFESAKLSGQNLPHPVEGDVASATAFLTKVKDAEEAEKKAGRALVIADAVRARLIETLPGPPIIRPRSKQK